MGDDDFAELRQEEAEAAAEVRIQLSIERMNAVRWDALRMITTSGLLTIIILTAMYLSCTPRH
jgi:hypothetical protein